MPFQLTKRLSRAMRITWREELTRHDVEALQANIRRVGLVIKLRWALVAVLAFYSVIAAILYFGEIEIEQLLRLMIVPAAALAFVVAYNIFFSLTYRRFGNLAFFNNLQLGLDVLVVGLLVYYSGGASSWFWSMIALFIAESAFIMQRRSDTWGIAIFGMLVLGVVLGAEKAGLLPHQSVPFEATTNTTNSTYVLVRYLWECTVLAGTASIATIGVAALTSDEAKRGTIIDPTTGLYSRSYFRRALTAEVGRARREHRPLHVVLIDVDQFGEFNRRFGLDRGDTMLRQIAGAICDTLSPYGDTETSGNVAARYGGEEFAVLLVEDAVSDSVPDPHTAHRLAQELCKAISAVRVDDAGVTVSVGLATFPLDGASADEMMDAADEALVSAVEAGGDRVIVAKRTPPTVPAGA